MIRVRISTLIVVSTNPAQPLATSAAIAELRGWLSSTEDRLITHARHADVSWAAIGKA